MALPDRLTHSCSVCARSCLRKFYYRYVLGIAKTKTASALRIGSAIHLGWERSRKGDPLPAVLDLVSAGYAVAPEWADHYEWKCEEAKVRAILRGYWAHYEGDISLEFVEVELPFDLPLMNPDTGGTSKTFRRAGKIDGVVRVDGRLMLLEGKTTSDPIDSGSDYWTRLRVDPQPSNYVLAARDVGHDVQSVVYDVIHKPAMSPQQIAQRDENGHKIVLDAAGQRVFTKDGKKPRETGDAALGYFVQTVPETPAEYEERLVADIASRPDFYFARREIPRLEDDLTEFRSELWQISQMLLECHRKGLWFRAVGKATCTGCDYAEVCLHSVKIDENGPLPAGYERLASLYPELDGQKTEDQNA